MKPFELHLVLADRKWKKEAPQNEPEIDFDILLDPHKIE